MTPPISPYRYPGWKFVRRDTRTHPAATSSAPGSARVFQTSMRGRVMRHTPDASAETVAPATSASTAPRKTANDRRFRPKPGSSRDARTPPTTTTTVTLSDARVDGRNRGLSARMREAHVSRRCHHARMRSWFSSYVRLNSCDGKVMSRINPTVISALTSALSGAPRSAAGDASDPATVDNSDGAKCATPSVSNAGTRLRPPATRHFVLSGLHASASMVVGTCFIVAQPAPASVVSPMTEYLPPWAVNRHAMPW